MYSVKITSRAEVELKRLDRPVRNRAVTAIVALVQPFTIMMTYFTAANGLDSRHSRESGNPHRTAMPELDARLRGHDPVA